MTDCVVLIPVLRRPHRVAPLLESLAASQADARPLFISSPDDTAEQDAIAATGADQIVIDEPPGPGDYARKINLGYTTTTEPLLFLAADDLHFHPGWLTAAMAKLEPGIGVVGTNDLGNPRVLRGVHSTHSLVTRAYADEHGTIDHRGLILHEGYWHEYCDDELVETSWYREAWAFAADSIVEHLHPAWGKAPLDDLYAMERQRMRHGKRLFLRRRRLWTPNNGPRTEP